MSIRRVVQKVVMSSVAALGFSAGASQAGPGGAPIDCAILICLSGGWPASAECSAARAEFIRRITPWPIEPPLQIWRCPMGSSINLVPSNQSTAPNLKGEVVEPESAVFRQSGGTAQRLPKDTMLQLVQGFSGGNGTADIDISGPEFDFVRSIRVFHVRMAMQSENDKNGCSRWASVELGTYGTQGDFRRRASSPSALPEAHTGMEGYGLNCPNIFHRSVFIDWRDYEGNYGFEQVNY